MNRRALGAAAVVTMLSSGLLPMLGTAHANACASWTDPKGDSNTNQMGLQGTQDANLDIVAASITTVGSTIVASVKVDDLAEGSYSDMGDEFVVQMSVAGTPMRFVAQRNETAESAKIGGLTNSGTQGLATAEFDPIDNTVRIRTTVAELDKVVGKASTGIAANSISASTSSQAGGETAMIYDPAAPPAGTTYTVGAQCDPVIPASTLPQPADGCTTFTDGPPGDGKPKVSTQEMSNENGLDITSVAINSTPDTLYAYIKVATLGLKPGNFQGDRFDLKFKAGAKEYTISAGRMYAGKTLGSYQTRGKVGTTTNPALKVRPTFDLPKNTVVIALEREGLDAVNGAPIGDGTTVTDVSAATTALIGGQEFPADTASATAAADRVYTFGNSPCFAPPPGVLANVGKTTVQYGDAAAVAAKLTDAAGAALGGKPVKFTIGSKSVTVPTGDDGVAKTSINPGLVAGKYSLVAHFAGDASASKVTLPTSFTVTQEKTRLVLTVAKSGTRRTVTAKLLDDDGKPVAGQIVTWYINGKKVSAPRTNSAGAVTLTTAKPTQTVKAVFAAVTGKYLGATAQKKV